MASVCTSVLVTLLVAVMKCPTEQPEGEEVYLGVQGHTEGSVPGDAEVRESSCQHGVRKQRKR